MIAVMLSRNDKSILLGSSMTPRDAITSIQELVDIHGELND